MPASHFGRRNLPCKPITKTPQHEQGVPFLPPRFPLTWVAFGNTEYVCINFLGKWSLSRSKRYDPMPDPVPPAMEWDSTNPCQKAIKSTQKRQRCPPQPSRYSWDTPSSAFAASTVRTQQKKQGQTLQYDSRRSAPHEGATSHGTLIFTFITRYHATTYQDRQER